MDDKRLADICNALSNEIRVKIIKMLSQREECACELLDRLHISQPTLSYHMKILSDSGLVSIRQDGKWKYYRISCGVFRDFKDSMSAISCTQKVRDASENTCATCSIE